MTASAGEGCNNCDLNDQARYEESGDLASITILLRACKVVAAHVRVRGRLLHSIASLCSSELYTEKYLKMRIPPECGRVKYRPSGESLSQSLPLSRCLWANPITLKIIRHHRHGRLLFTCIHLQSWRKKSARMRHNVGLFSLYQLHAIQRFQQPTFMDGMLVCLVCQGSSLSLSLSPTS
jgi:hypothetical protein